MVPGNDWALGLLQALTGNLNLLPATSLAVILSTALWRRISHGRWPELADCAGLAAIVYSAYTGTVLTLVLTGTYPPRFGLVSQKELMLAGMYVFLLTAYGVTATLNRILFPPQPAIPPPQSTREALDKMSNSVGKRDQPERQMK